MAVEGMISGVGSVVVTVSTGTVDAVVAEDVTVVATDEAVSDAAGVPVGSTTFADATGVDVAPCICAVWDVSAAIRGATVEGVTVGSTIVEDGTGVDWVAVAAISGVADAVEEVAADGDDSVVVAMTVLVLVVEVGIVVFVVTFNAAPAFNNVLNTVSVACSKRLSGTPAISPFESRRLGGKAGLELVWLVVPPTSTLTNSSAGLDGVNNALMALVRSVLVALALNPNDKANCCCCPAVRPETKTEGTNDCNGSVTLYVIKSKGLEAARTVMELGVGKTISDEAATLPTAVEEVVFCKG